MSGYDRTPNRSDVSVSPTRARERMRAACACIGCGRTHRRKTGSRPGTRVLEELAGDAESKTTRTYGAAQTAGSEARACKRQSAWRVAGTANGG